MVPTQCDILYHVSQCIINSDKYDMQFFTDIQQVIFFLSVAIQFSCYLILLCCSCLSFYWRFIHLHNSYIYVRREAGYELPVRYMNIQTAFRILKTFCAMSDTKYGAYTNSQGFFSRRIISHNEYIMILLKNHNRKERQYTKMYIHS